MATDLVNQSRRDRDIIALTCRNDKLIQIRALRNRLREHPARSAAHRRVRTVLARQIEVLLDEAFACTSGTEYFHGVVE